MDQYSLVKVIGQGSFGRALLVQPINGEQNYVMKEIRLPKDDSGIRNSRREAVLLSRMKHSNVVAFIDSFEADGHLYIVMEFCSGGDLLLKIRQQKNVLFTEDVILKWFAQMCLGTKHIHDKRVLHRDLKSKKKELVQERTHHWKREEGEKVAMFLGQKSLVTTTSTEGTLQEEQSTFENNCIDDPASRKRWAVGTCNTVMGVLRNADIISTGSMENAEQTDLISEAEYVETQERRVRKQWDKDPPERLLSILEKVQLCYGFETYTLRRDEHGDKVDGPEMMITDYSRLEPRSDDEDTDFEEECPYDWINELEEMMS